MKTEQIKVEFSGQWCGASSVYYGLKDIESGLIETVSFAIADHPMKYTQNKLHSIVTIGRAMVRGVLCWRFCGEGNKPDGASSYAVCASWNDQDLGLASAVVASYLTQLAKENDAWIFRQ